MHTSFVIVSIILATLIMLSTPAGVSFFYGILIWLGGYQVSMMGMLLIEAAVLTIVQKMGKNNDDSI